jgi:large subunit ribosomal protein L7Ae
MTKGGNFMANTKFKASSELQSKQLELIEKASKNSKIRIGVNEVTKAIERGQAKLVLIADDVNPAEIVMHLPILCSEKKIPFSFIATKKSLGEKAGISVGTAAIALTDDASVKKELEEVVKKIQEERK